MMCVLLPGDHEDAAPQSLTDIVVNYGGGGGADGELSLMSLSDQWHAPASNLHINYTCTTPAATAPTQQDSGSAHLDIDIGVLKVSHSYEPSSLDPDSASVDYETIPGKSYQLEQTIELASYCHSVQLVDGKLWCVEADRDRLLVIRPDDGSVVRTATYTMILHPTCVINTSAINGECRLDDPT